ncbi:MAG: hypothetical protein N2043_02000 [Ignavibacterium sp.]|nr:hypothetical protein [Ignavibacterium sp.]
MSNEKRYLLWKESGYCDMYDPCPICYKCMVKASHLYNKCEYCPVEFCAHDNKKRNLLISRENFAIDVTDETGKEFIKLSQSLEKQNQ